MKKLGLILYRTLNILLAAITIIGFGTLTFRQLPTDDVHYGYGMLIYTMVFTPFIILPLIIFSTIGTVVQYQSNRKASVLYLLCFAIGLSGLVLAIALGKFPELYEAINL